MRSSAFFIAASCAALTACGSGQKLADGPIELTGMSHRVQFIQPVAAGAGGWELCFEFSTPADSQKAHQIESSLLSEAGRVIPLTGPRLDRRGESRVCHIFAEPVAAPGAPPTLFTGVILGSSIPISLRGIRGGPPAP